MGICVDNKGIPFNCTANARMSIDNLRNVEIVLASGEIVQANHQVNSDLFWAIRGISVLPMRRLISGGASNFGVVTEFTYQAYPHSNSVYSGMLIFYAAPSGSTRRNVRQMPCETPKSSLMNFHQFVNTD